jgi:virginiamycin B lyase
MRLSLQGVAAQALAVQGVAAQALAVRGVASQTLAVRGVASQTLGIMKRLLTFRVGLAVLAATSVFAQPPGTPPSQRPARPPKPGVKTPGVQIPFASLKPDYEFPDPGAPDWIALGESVWISNSPKNTVTRIDPKTNKIADTVTGLNRPCSGLAIGFGSLWVPNCGDQTLARVDLKTAKITATIPTGVANSEGGLAVTADSVWLLTDAKSTLARLDPDKNTIVAEVRLPAGCFTVAFGPPGPNAALWVTCTQANQVLRVDPVTNLVTNRMKLGTQLSAPLQPSTQPRFLTVGEGAVWVLCQGEGNVVKIDPKTMAVVATIEVGIPGGGGDIAAGEGAIWVSSFGFPISKIDPKSGKVVQQFVGEGGDAIRAGGGAVWLSNLRQGVVWRLDPRRIAATLAE